jgi:protein-disulfide isomerase
VALFSISETILQVLCPICVGLYVVNILLAVVVAWAFGGRVFIHPLRALGDFLKLLLTPRKFLMLLGIAIIMYSVPQVVSVVWRLVVGPSAIEGAVAAWRLEIPRTLSVNADTSAFGDYAKGSSAANVVELVEFTDFECPYCRRFSLILDEVLDKYKGQVRLILKNFPLDMSCNKFMTHDLHKSACLAAESARCAGEQGKFWEAAAWLYTTPLLERNHQQASADLTKILTSELKLDSLAMDECLTSGRQRKVIEAEIAQAAALEVSGTPTLWINRRQVRSLQPQIVEAIVAEAVREASGHR